MPYRFIDDEATADVAFEACGKDLSEVFRDAGDAVTNVMIENLVAIEPREAETIHVDNEQLDLLLFNLLERLVYYKDARQLLLRLGDLAVWKSGDTWHARGVARGETLDPARHHQHVDVKAVTLHDFSLEHANGQWCVHVVLDI